MRKLHRVVVGMAAGNNAMTYVCTNPACGWRGGPTRLSPFCPLCGALVEDLDHLERKAIRQDAGFSEEDAERLAKEDMEKWREGECI